MPGKGKFAPTPKKAHTPNESIDRANKSTSLLKDQKKSTNLNESSFKTQAKKIEIKKRFKVG